MAAEIELRLAHVFPGKRLPDLRNHNRRLCEQGYRIFWWSCQHKSRFW